MIIIMTVSLVRPDTDAFLLLNWYFNWNFVALLFVFLSAVLLGNFVAFWNGIGIAMLLWDIVALWNGLLVTLFFCIGGMTFLFLFICGFCSVFSVAFLLLF